MLCCVPCPKYRVIHRSLLHEAVQHSDPQKPLLKKILDALNPQDKVSSCSAWFPRSLDPWNLFSCCCCSTCCKPEDGGEDNSAQRDEIVASLLKLEQVHEEATHGLIGANKVIRNKGLAKVAQMENRIRTVRENLQMGGADELKLLDQPSPDGRTALHLTTEQNDAKTTILLLEAGANPNVKDVQGNSPLHTVCRNKDIQTATYILEKNGRFLTNRKSQTPDIGDLIFEHRERKGDVEKMMQAVGQSNHRKEILEEILRRKNLLFRLVKEDRSKIISIRA